MDSVERVAEVVLYEGYLLFPYTRSALKNQQRWTFGGVYPRPYSQATGEHDPWVMQTQCLVLGEAKTEIEVKVRFLHILDRTVERGGISVADLRAGGELYYPMEEATERQLVGAPVTLGDLAAGCAWPITVAAGSERESIPGVAGGEAAAVVRAWQAIQAEVEARAEPVDGHCHRLTVRITNTLPWPRRDPSSVSRPEVLRHTLISTHTILRVRGGEFVSLLEPPQELAGAAQACANIKTWPVLAGTPGSRSTVLSSPIILYDYPQVSPESHGDFFDSTEIDELLTLGVMTLTDREKEEMRSGDARSREILERTESLTPEQILQLHASVRTLQVREEGP